MCFKFENLREIDWKSYFWEIWVRYKFFEMYFISYSCILFIKCYALRSFYIKLLCFSKICFLQNFDSRPIEPVSRLIENTIKNLSWVCLAQLVLDQSNIIFDRLNLFFDQSKIVQRVFKIISFSHVLSLFKLSQKFFLSLFDQSRLKAHYFVIFPQISSRFFEF